MSLIKNKTFHCAIVIVLLAVILAAAVLTGGCGSRQGSESSSSEGSAEPSSAVADGAGGAAQAAAAPESGTGSSASSGDGYVLPASSGVSSAVQEPEAESSAPSSRQSQSSAASKELFQSLFGDSSQSSGADGLKDANGSKISLSEYDKIEDNMTYAQIKGIIGGDGALQREQGRKGSNLYVQVYRWNGTGSSDSYADFTFDNGKLSMKIQFGLQ